MNSPHEGAQTSLTWRVALFLESLASKIDIKMVLAASLILHVFAMSFPRDAKVFDEAYYVPAALDILKLVPSNIEHPFLGKAWIALGIMIFGDNWFGWRIPSVVFGVLSLYVFYRLSLHFLSRGFAIYGSLLLALENMFFVHSSLALLEPPSIFFALLAFYLYFSKRYFWSALALGFSVLGKETGFFYVLTLALYHVASNTHVRLTMKTWVKPVLFLALTAATILIPMTAYDLVYKPQETVVKVQTNVYEYPSPAGEVTSRETVTSSSVDNTPISNALQHILYTVKYASSLKITEQKDVNPGNYAWNWILPIPNAYPVMTYYAITLNKTITVKTDGIESTRSVLTQPIAWFGVGNMPLWWTIWIITPLATYTFTKKRSQGIELFILTWIGTNYLPMLYLSLIVQRIVYPFYFLNTVPALALGIPYLASLTSADKRTLVFGFSAYFTAVLIFFLYYYPVRILEQ